MLKKLELMVQNKTLSNSNLVKSIENLNCEICERKLIHDIEG